jgi:hypothetical protein
MEFIDRHDKSLSTWVVFHFNHFVPKLSGISRGPCVPYEENICAEVTQTFGRCQNQTVYLYLKLRMPYFQSRSEVITSLYSLNRRRI